MPGGCITNVFALIVAALVASAVVSDADKLRQKGAKVTPSVWGILVFLLMLIALPIYLILRITTWRKQIDLAQGLAPRPMTTAQVTYVTLLSGVILFGAVVMITLLAWLWGPSNY